MACRVWCFNRMGADDFAVRAPPELLATSDGSASVEKVPAIAHAGEERTAQLARRTSQESGDELSISHAPSSGVRGMCS
jgi:hypothetical protein